MAIDTGGLACWLRGSPFVLQVPGDFVFGVIRVHRLAGRQMRLDVTVEVDEPGVTFLVERPSLSFACTCTL